jgi:hypothetical protein
VDARSRLVLAGVAALVAAMLGRMGWVDWLAVLHTAEKVGCIALIILERDDFRSEHILSS